MKRSPKTTDVLATLGAKQSKAKQRKCIRVFPCTFFCFCVFRLLPSLLLFSLSLSRSLSLHKKRPHHSFSWKTGNSSHVSSFLPSFLLFSFSVCHFSLSLFLLWLVCLAPSRFCGYPTLFFSLFLALTLTRKGDGIMFMFDPSFLSFLSAIHSLTTKRKLKKIYMCVCVCVHLCICACGGVCA